MAKFSAASALTLATLFLAATSCLCANLDDQLPDSILVQILGSKYTTFVKLLANSDLLSDLESDDRFNAGVTIFATTDEYFADKVSPSVLQFLEQPENFPLLRKVLLTHIVPGKFGARSWYPGEVVTTLSGTEARFHLDAGDLKVNNAVVKEFGVLESTDGLVHALDGFLVPDELEQNVGEYSQTAFVVEEGRRDMMEEGFFAAPPMTTPILSPPSPPSMAAPAPAPEPAPALAPAPAPSSSPTSLDELLTLLATFKSLLALIQSNQEFADFLGALLEAGTPITILAPSDAAISAANLTGYDVLTVLKNHVAQGAYSYDDLLNMSKPSTSRRLLDTGSLSSYANNTLDLTKTSDGTLEVNGAIVTKGVLDDPNVSAVQIEKVLAPDNAKITTPTPPPPPGSGARFGVSISLLVAALALGSALVL